MSCLAREETNGTLARLCLATTVDRVIPMMRGSMKVAWGAVTSTGASVGGACYEKVQCDAVTLLELRY